MKKYNKPTLNIENIEITDIILTSGQGEINGNKVSDETIVFPNVVRPGL